MKEMNYMISAKQYQSVLKTLKKRAFPVRNQGIHARIYYAAQDQNAEENEQTMQPKTKLVYEEKDALLAENQKKTLTPAMYIAWDEETFDADHGASLTITMKCNMRSRMDDICFEMGSAGKLILSNGQVIMNIKRRGVQPFWLAKMILQNKLKPCLRDEYDMAYEKLIS